MAKQAIGEKVGSQGQFAHALRDWDHFQDLLRVFEIALVMQRQTEAEAHQADAFELRVFFDDHAEACGGFVEELGRVRRLRLLGREGYEVGIFRLAKGDRGTQRAVRKLLQEAFTDLVGARMIAGQVPGSGEPLHQFIRTVRQRFFIQHLLVDSGCLAVLAGELLRVGQLQQNLGPARLGLRVGHLSRLFGRLAKCVHACIERGGLCLGIVRIKVGCMRFAQPE